MELLVQLTFSGLTNGAVYAMAALGFVLIYKASDVINFSQGELLLIGAYATFFFIGQLAMPWPVGILGALLVALAVGVSVERLVLRPMIGESNLSVIMVTIGLASVLRSLVNIIWGPLPQAFPAFIPSGEVEILGAIVPEDRLWAIGLAALMLGGFSLFFRKSADGIAMRAVADDQQAALSMGISVRRIFAVAWSIAAISATIAGLLLANIIGVSGDIAQIGLHVFPVIILGGIDSIGGAVVGGVVIGLLEAWIGGYVGQGLGQVLPFVLLVVILMVRPYGLFGQEIIERV